MQYISGCQQANTEFRQARHDGLAAMARRRPVLLPLRLFCARSTLIAFAFP